MANNQCATYDDEQAKLLKIIKFRLPNSFKMLGLVAALLVFALLFAYKFIDGNTLLVKDICRTVILLFLFIASLSREPIEDEFVQHVRSQSYVVAFISALAYAIGIPLIALVFDILITGVSGDGQVGFYQVSSFEVMFILVCFQLLFFETMKRLAHVK